MNDREAPLLSSVLPLNTHLGFNFPLVWKAWAKEEFLSSLQSCCSLRKIHLGISVPSAFCCSSSVAPHIEVSCQEPYAWQEDFIHLKMELDKFVGKRVVLCGFCKSKENWSGWLGEVDRCSCAALAGFNGTTFICVKQSTGPAVPYLEGVAGCFNVSIPWIFQLGLDFADELTVLPLTFQRSFQTCRFDEGWWEQSPEMEKRLNRTSLSRAEWRGGLGVASRSPRRSCEDTWGCRQWIQSLFSVSYPSLLMALIYLQTAWE